MAQTVGLWDLLFGVSDPGNTGSEIKPDVGLQQQDADMQFVLPDDFNIMDILASCGDPSAITGEEQPQQILDQFLVKGGTGLNQEENEYTELIDSGMLDEYLSAGCDQQQICYGASSESGCGSMSDETSSLSEPGSPSVQNSPGNSFRVPPSGRGRRAARAASIVSSFAGSISEADDEEKKELILTKEELSLLQKEGLSLPKFLPLSKQDDRLLKKIRRKIRNKLSAQKSRTNKKTYVENLEQENRRLKRHSDALEKENNSLKAQLKTLQGVLQQQGGALRGGVQLARANPKNTCLMALILSVALILTPYGKSSTEKQAQTDALVHQQHLMANSQHVAADQLTQGRTRILYSMNAPPDITSDSAPAHLKKHAENFDIKFNDLEEATEKLASVSLEGWNEPFAEKLIVLPSGKMQIIHEPHPQPNRSTAAR